MKFYIYKNARKIKTIDNESELYSFTYETMLKTRGNVDGFKDDSTVDELVDLIEKKSNYKVTMVDEIETYKGYVLRQLSGYENCVEWGDGNIADDVEAAKQDIDDKIG
jgi:hypothetical protein